MISCIIPVYNGERYLGEAVESVLAQPHHPLELIVVDDGSTDATATVAAAYGPAVRYVYQANAGPAAAVNHGLRAAHGEFLAVIDADDRWPPDRLTRQLDHFQRRPDLDVSLGHVLNFWTTELEDEARRFSNHRLSRPIPGYLHTTMLARRRVFEAVGYLNPDRRHGFATDWFLRVRDHGCMVEMLPDVLLHRRMHPDNRSRRFAARSRSEFLDILKQSLDRQRRSAGQEPRPTSETS